MLTSDPAPFPLHVSQISMLLSPHIVIKTVSQVTTPPRMIAIVPSAFNDMPTPDCHYSFMEPLAPHKSQQNVLVVPVFKIFGEKLVVC